MRLPWKESSALILASQNSIKAPEFLVISRSSKSSFFPNVCAFPGGSISCSDSDSKWVDLFNSSHFSFKAMIDKLCFDRPKCNLTAADRNGLPGDIVFRIAAIRETFEETGILLGYHTKCDRQQFSEKILNDWQSRLLKNQDSFHDLCVDLSILPAIGELYEWINFLTPNNLNTKRHNTIFYIANDSCNLSPKNYISPSESELSEAFFICIDQLSLGKKSYILAPPQAYIFAGLSRFSSTNVLMQHVVKRSSLGLPSMMMPSIFKCKDCTLNLLPGDFEYPSEVTYKTINDEQSGLDATMESLINASKNNNVNRAVMSKVDEHQKIIVIKNFVDDYGHGNFLKEFFL